MANTNTDILGTVDASRAASAMVNACLGKSTDTMTPDAPVVLDDDRTLKNLTHHFIFLFADVRSQPFSRKEPRFGYPLQSSWSQVSSSSDGDSERKEEEEGRRPSPLSLRVRLYLKTFTQVVGKDMHYRSIEDELFDISSTLEPGITALAAAAANPLKSYLATRR
jgi:hypothetical protein